MTQKQLRKILYQFGRKFAEADISWWVSRSKTDRRKAVEWAVERLNKEEE